MLTESFWAPWEAVAKTELKVQEIFKEDYLWKVTAEWTEVGKKSLRPRGRGLTPLKRTRGRWNTEQKEPRTAALRKSRPSWWEPEGHDCLLEHFCSGRSGLTWALSTCSDISSNIWEEWGLYASVSADPEGVALEVVSWLYSQQFLTSREFPVAHQRPAEVSEPFGVYPI